MHRLAQPERAGEGGGESPATAAAAVAVGDCLASGHRETVEPQQNKRCVLEAYHKNFLEKSLEDNFRKSRFYVGVHVILLTLC